MSADMRQTDTVFKVMSYICYKANVSSTLSVSPGASVAIRGGCGILGIGGW